MADEFQYQLAHQLAHNKEDRLMNLKIKTLGIFGAALTLVACGGGSSSQFAENPSSGAGISFSVISESSGPENSEPQFVGLTDGTLMSSAVAETEVASVASSAVSSKVGTVDGQVKGLSLSVGSRSASFSWASYPEATSYLVTRTDGLSGFSETVEVFSSSYSDNLLVEGQEYLFQISAVTAEGVSSPAVARVVADAQQQETSISFN